MILHRNTSQRGATTAEYIIKLVLIAVGCIVLFMILGTTLRQQGANSINKISGRDSTYTESQRVEAATDTMESDVVDMTQTEGGAAEADSTVDVTN